MAQRKKNRAQPTCDGNDNSARTVDIQRALHDGKAIPDVVTQYDEREREREGEREGERRVGGERERGERGERETERERGGRGGWEGRERGERGERD